jgi:hypothetical protein
VDLERHSKVTINPADYNRNYGTGSRVTAWGRQRFRDFAINEVLKGEMDGKELRTVNQ